MSRIARQGIAQRCPERETIYRYIYSKEGMAQELWWYLPLHRKNRTPRRARKRQKSKFDRDVSILFRPPIGTLLRNTLSGHCCAIPCRAMDDVALRREFGHWKANLMLLKQKRGQTNVTTLVERVSRFTVILKNPNKRTKPVMRCPTGLCAA